MTCRLFLAALAASASAAAIAQQGAAPPAMWQPANLERSAFLRSAAPRGILVATQFGARPNDGRDDGRAIAAALGEAAARGAAAVLLPAGRYDLGGEVRLPSGVALIGEGCGRTLIARSPGHRGQMMFRLDGASRVRVQGIAFEYQGAPPFFRALGLRGAGSADIAILDNCFDDSRPGGGSGDRTAINLSAETSPSSRIWISGNRVRGAMQLTSGGGAGITTLRIVGNDIAGARNAGIAVSHLVAGARYRDLRIEGNRIVNSAGLGIYVGPDQATAVGGSFEDVAIVGNEIRGFTGRFPIAIYLRAAGRRTSGITIAGNRLAGNGNNNVAIRMEDSHGRGARRFTNVVVEGNEAVNFERGIWIQAVDGGRVRGNRVAGVRGLLVSPAENRSVDVRP